MIKNGILDVFQYPVKKKYYSKIKTLKYYKNNHFTSQLNNFIFNKKYEFLF